MQFLVKLLMSSLYGEQNRKDIEEKIACKSEHCMMSEYDEGMKEFRKISHGNNFVKMVVDAGLKDDFKNLNTMPLHLGGFVLSNSKGLRIISFMLSMGFIQLISTTKILIVCILRTSITKN